MEISPIHQVVHEDLDGVRFGDVLREFLEDGDFTDFYFAVAFLRSSGFDYIGESLSEFLDEGGDVLGVAGVDNRVTSREALEQLASISEESTVFSTSTDLIFHPKVYIFENADERAALVFGSGNLTRDGLFRNVEFGAVLEFDLSNPGDREFYRENKRFVDALLDDSHPNVRPITEDVLDTLEATGKIVSESESGGNGGRTTGTSSEGEESFPPIETPELPTPTSLSAGRSDDSWVGGSVDSDRTTLVIQLSEFDSSHQPGTPGTEEVLIPMDAVDFFPEITESSHEHPDVYFDVELQTSAGPESQEYRFWYYDTNREWRLRLQEATMERVSPEGGSLLVVSKRPDVDSAPFEVRVVNQGDDGFAELSEHCTREVGDKMWGFVD